MERKINWKYEIGDHITDNNRDMIITDRKVVPTKKTDKRTKCGYSMINVRYYEYLCNKCNNKNLTDEITLYHHHSGCPNCFTWEYEIGDSIVDDKRNLIIIDRKIIPRKNKDKTCKKGYAVIKEKWYQYQCNICGWKGDERSWVAESQLKRGCGCSCCKGHTAVKGINTVGDLRPDLINYFKNKDDAFKYTLGRNTYVNCLCPDCGHKKRILLSNLVRFGLMCPKCSDGISFPEKFMMSVLDQLNIDYIFQLSCKNFKWIGKYRYDFYIKNLNMIIETHGPQHYEECGFSKFTSLEDTKTNDRIKKNLAIHNGISKNNYIIIDSRISELEWVKNSITKSKLNKIFDLSLVDWNQCLKDAQKNLVKEVCDYYEDHSTNQVVKKFHLHKQTINRYVNIGELCGWC